MTKLTVNKTKKTLTPSEEIISNANKVYEAVDTSGRRITIKIPSFQDNLKYDLYFGKHEESNKRFYESNKFILFIKEIDGDIVSFPCGDNEALALASRIGNEGLNAVMEKINEVMADTLSTLESDSSEEEDRLTVKK